MTTPTPDDLDGATPEWHSGVPFCTQDRCRHYDGKRCRQLGQRPDNICEPAVRVMAERIQEGDSRAAEMRSRCAATQVDCLSECTEDGAQYAAGWDDGTRAMRHKILTMPLEKGGKGENGG